MEVDAPEGDDVRVGVEGKINNEWVWCQEELANYVPTTGLQGDNSQTTTRRDNQ